MKEYQAYSFFLGTYTDKDSQGIYKYQLNKDGTIEVLGLAAKSNNPSYLAKSIDNRILLAINEIDRNDTGYIESFMVKENKLDFISSCNTGGTHPCFISINEKGFVLAANYNGGNVGLLKINNDGKLSTLLDVQQHKGKGINDRQDKPHAHSAWFANQNEIISVDLGTNELWLSSIDSIKQKLIPSNQQTLAMNPGAGPRHLTFHPNENWLYVVNELDCTVTLVKKTATAKYEKCKSISTLPEDYTEFNTCADIRISSDGKFLYASNRGHNSIVIYNVNANDGNLTLLGFESTRGDGPRNFSLSPDERYIVVANENTNNLVSFQRDTITGLLEFVNQIEAPSPVCILF